MIKRVFYTLFTILLFGCVTDRSQTDFVEIPETKPVNPTTSDSEKPTPLDETPVNDVLLELDDETKEIVIYISDLIKRSEWEELALLTDEIIYNSYITESGGAFIDYIMFMLHTGEEGNATSNSLNSIDELKYIDLISSDKKVELIGNFIYENREEEYFKIILLIDDGFIITRD